MARRGRPRHRAAMKDARRPKQDRSSGNLVGSSTKGSPSPSQAGRSPTEPDRSPSHSVRCPIAGLGSSGQTVVAVPPYRSTAKSQTCPARRPRIKAQDAVRTEDLAGESLTTTKRCSNRECGLPQRHKSTTMVNS
jgi:hypothetical protein